MGFLELLWPLKCSKINRINFINLNKLFTIVENIFTFGVFHAVFHAVNHAMLEYLNLCMWIVENPTYP